ncbi:DUF3859 domain-containing protein [Stutzerimonas azotifigens]|uniref:DUF3859 domain-containing protein n=1 Tax=Stutzerimonas azotifigens TaxID=291995 RepID=A0ABR5Z328_9GAMM|nr:DUF3859 domain-containing protein [Stutzerimonas azotifigens]MBA1274616.1 DUF3859 domain-containing protein [Stutzerimonas azotifigens]
MALRTSFFTAAALALALSSGLALGEVTLEGPIEFGVFESQHRDPQPGERVISRSDQRIQPGSQVPAKLGTKFGMRYRLSGKRTDDMPLTLLYLTPGVVTPDGKRHDKFEVQQKLVPEAPVDVMAFEFSESHEVVPGQWYFMVFHGDRKLAEQRFDVR